MYSQIHKISTTDCQDELFRNPIPKFKFILNLGIVFRNQNPIQNEIPKCFGIFRNSEKAVFIWFPNSQIPKFPKFPNSRRFPKIGDSKNTCIENRCCQEIFYGLLRKGISDTEIPKFSEFRNQMKTALKYPCYFYNYTEKLIFSPYI